MNRTIGELEARAFILWFYNEMFHKGTLDALGVAFSEKHVAHGAGCLPGGGEDRSRS